MKYTAHEFVAIRKSIEADAYSAGTVSGSSVDTLGFGECLVVVNLGEPLTTSGTATIKIQENANDVGTGWTDVASATFGALANANKNTVWVGRLDLTERKRYLRAHLVVANEAFDVGVTFDLLAAKDLAVSQTNAVKFNV